MTDAVITAFIAGGATSLTALIGQVGAYAVQKKKSYEAHMQAQEELSEKIEKKLDDHRKEYMAKIDTIDEKVDVLKDFKKDTEKWQSNMDIKFENLSADVKKKNELVERMTKAEIDIARLQEK